MVTYPGDWAVYAFDEMFQLYPNNTLSRDKLSEHGTIGDIHYGDVLIKYGSVLTGKDSIPKIKEEYESLAKTRLQKNDVIVADTAEDETVGKAVQIGDVPFPIVGGLHTVICRPLVATATGYLGYYMNSREYHNQLLPYIAGIKVSSISKTSLRRTEFHIPSSVDEQAAIVDTIERFDTHISNLAALIEKKRAVRDAALEDLVSGRTRLDGHDCAWVRVELGSLASYRKERAVCPQNQYVSTENMRQMFSGIIPYAGTEPTAGTAFFTGDTLIANIRPYLKKVWRADFSGACSADVLVMASNEKVSPNLLYYCLANDNFINYVMNGGVKGIKMPRGDKKYILQYPILIPADIAEQETIADMLTAMDDEIKSLEAERDKMTQIREGVMDDLLTGRKRLKQSP